VGRSSSDHLADKGVLWGVKRRILDQRIVLLFLPKCPDAGRFLDLTVVAHAQHFRDVRSVDANGLYDESPFVQASDLSCLNLREMCSGPVGSDPSQHYRISDAGLSGSVPITIKGGRCVVNRPQKTALFDHVHDQPH
jgi:hypothetical protein